MIDLTYETENRLTSVSGGTSASFYYDGDGARVKGTVGEVTTTYIGNWFEWTGSTSTMKKYYYAGGTRAAMRVGSTTLYYLLGDHLGRTSVIANPSGGMAGMQYYEAWGETRYTSGTRPTTYQYTGQRHEQSVGGGTEGLYYYGARWLDVSLGRFLSADSVIPQSAQGVQAWDRFAYANNNPVRYSDPTGHRACDGKDSDENCKTVNSEDLTQLLSFSYGWKVVGKWSKRDLNRLLDVGIDLKAHYFELTGGWGTGWIRRNMGNAVIQYGPTLKKSFVIANMVFFSPVFYNWGKAHVAHELAHIMDNNYAGGGLGATILGGGKSDEMIKDVGGNPFGGLCGFLPYQCAPGYINYVAGPDPWHAGAYGNNSVMDDFAETFAYSVYDPSRVPQSRLNWMNKFISTSGLP